MVLIGFFIIRSLVRTGPVGTPERPKNQSIRKVEDTIDLLRKLPDSRSFADSKGLYRLATYYIEDYYKQGLLGVNPPSDTSGNRQNKEYLTSNLYFTYAEKFIKQAFYVFRHSEWKIDELNSIRREYQRLQKSQLLVKDSPLYNRFTEIQDVFSKYDEITSFIFNCRNFSYSDYGLRDRFPVQDVNDIIARANTYLHDNLENEHVNHCKRLRDGLEEIPQVLFKAHVRYLYNKIDKWSGLYSVGYNSHIDYTNNLYKPLKSEIDELDNDIYNVANFDVEYTRLTNKWSVDNRKAYDYDYSKN